MKAVDSVCHDYIIAERIKRGKQKTDEPRMSEFLTIAEGLGLGVAMREKIKVRTVEAA